MSGSRGQGWQGGHGFHGGPPFGGFPGMPPFRGMPFGGHGGRRGPRARRGDVRAAIMALLAEQPRNGYQIIQAISERSDGVWRPSPGSVYPALQQLEDEGLVHTNESEGRRAFQLTDEGHTYVREHEEELAAPWDAVTESVGDGILGLREAVGQLAMAAMQVAQAGTEKQVDDALRILSNARKSMYRILAEESAEESDDAGVDSDETP